MEPPVQGVKEVRGDLTDLESLKVGSEVLEAHHDRTDVCRPSQTAAEEIKLLTRGKLDLLILASCASLLRPQLTSSAQAMSPNPVMGHGEEAQIADVILPAIAQSTSKHAVHPLMPSSSRTRSR